MVSTGLPWTSCQRLSPVQLSIYWTLHARGIEHLWAFALALPLLVLTGIASLETRGRPYPAPRRTLALTAAGALTSIAITMFTNIVALANWSGGVRIALTFALIAPPALMAAWALARRARNAEPLASRWIAGYAAFAMPVAWAGHLDRAGALLGFLSSCALLVLATAVKDEPSPLGARGRTGVLAATCALILLCTALMFGGYHRPHFLAWPPPRF